MTAKCQETHRQAERRYGQREAAGDAVGVCGEGKKRERLTPPYLHSPDERRDTRRESNEHKKMSAEKQVRSSASRECFANVLGRRHGNTPEITRAHRPVLDTREEQSQAKTHSFFLSKDSGEKERERAELRMSREADAHMSKRKKAKTETKKVARHVRVRSSGPIR